MVSDKIFIKNIVFFKLVIFNFKYKERLVFKLVNKIINIRNNVSKKYRMEKFVNVYNI